MIATSTYGLVVLRDSILEDRRTETREIINLAYSIAKYYGQQAETGKLPVDTAKEMAQTAIAALRDVPGLGAKAFEQAAQIAQ